MLHAVFFSRETHQPKPLDPDVFVADAAAKAGIGPQGIRHVAGFPPAFLADPPSAALFNADGHPLGFALAEWLAAKGSAQISPAAAGVTAACRFTALLPNGVYSLFENHFDQTPIGFTPLDGTGETNNFTAAANGQAIISVAAPHPLTHANAILLVYHSDHRAHGLSRGVPGVTAHHQLIARMPA
jgi:hypothetical protein